MQIVSWMTGKLDAFFEEGVLVSEDANWNTPWKPLVGQRVAILFARHYWIARVEVADFKSGGLYRRLVLRNETGAVGLTNNEFQKVYQRW